MLALAIMQETGSQLEVYHYCVSFGLDLNCLTDWRERKH